MDIYIGIDGGGTGTKICIINKNEEVLFLESGDRSSVDTVTFETSFKNINNILKKYDFSNKNVVSVFAGIGGIVTNSDKNKLVSLLKNASGINDNTKIFVENDVANALASGLIFDDGMTLIVGTGMSAFGKKGDKTHKAGGWGFKEGDAGSSYDLGYQAIKIAIRASDNRIAKSAFTNEVSQTIGLNQAKDIIPIMDELHNNRTKVASYAPIVTKHANLGDKYALKIVETATDELALAVSAVYETLGFDEVIVVIVGSLGNASGIFKDLLHKKIKEINKKIEITSPKVDPAVAAAMLAMRSV